MGLKPVVIERLSGYGGSFIGTEGMTGLEIKYTSGENCPMFAGAYNPNQPYGVKNAMNTCLNFHHWIPQHKLYENFFGQMNETIDWLEGHGIKFADVIAIGAGPKIWHVYDKGDNASPGGYFMQCFGKEAENLGVEAYFDTYGRKLIMEDGKVAGVLAEDEKGNVLKVEAPVVVIATGGYSNNSEFLYGVSETKNVNIQALGMDCRDGDGIKMAKDAGADMAEGLGTVMWCGPVTLGAITATWTTDAYSAGVQATVDQYNQACAAAAGLDGEDTSADEEFGKRAKYMHAVDAGPYWLCEVGDGYYTTCGGIKVNEKTQVLDENGEVIPGLYAGGSDAGGLYGDSYDVKFAPGSQAAWAVNSGRLDQRREGVFRLKREKQMSDCSDRDSDTLSKEGPQANDPRAFLLQSRKPSSTCLPRGAG